MIEVIGAHVGGPIRERMTLLTTNEIAGLIRKPLPVFLSKFGCGPTYYHIDVSPRISTCAYDPDTWCMHLYLGCACMCGKGMQFFGGKNARLLGNVESGPILIL